MLGKVSEQYEVFAVDYLNEVGPAVDDMEHLILCLTDTSKRPSALKQVTRLVHSIKGSAGGYGFDLISSICHSFEDHLTAIRLNTDEIDNQIDDLLKYIDVLKATVRAYQKVDNSALEEIRQKIGRGAQLTVEPTMPGPAPKTLTALERSRILIIERSFTFLRTYSRVVNSLNADVEIATAQDGYDGLGRLIKSKFHCVIMSNLADYISGTELLRILSQIQNPNSQTPFILLTSAQHLEIGQTTNKFYIIKKTGEFLAQLDERLKSILSPPIQTSDADSEFTLPFEKILLIDDSKDIHLLASIAFKKYKGAKFKALSSGLEAAEEIGRFNPDLILLDYQMPEMDGIAVARMLRQKYPKIPFVFLTGATTAEDRAMLMREGSKAVFKKPFPPKELPRWIKSLC